MVDQALPLYKRILLDLKEKLGKGVWSIGEQFPSEKELMEMYDVSSITVRRVILELVNEGWLERRHGIGTFVKKEYVENLNKLTGFFEEIRKKGRIPTAKVLEMAELEVTKDLLDTVPLLELFNSERVLKITKVHYIDNAPVEYLESYWRPEISKILDMSELASQGIYEIISKKQPNLLTYADQEIKAVGASKKIADYLQITAAIPVLLVERVTYDYLGKVLEVACTTYHPYKYRCKIMSKTTANMDSNILFDPVLV